VTDVSQTLAVLNRTREKKKKKKEKDAKKTTEKTKQNKTRHLPSEDERMHKKSSPLPGPATPLRSNPHLQKLQAKL